MGRKRKKIHFTRLDGFIRGSGKKTGRMGGIDNPPYSFILFLSNIRRKMRSF